MSKNVRRVDEPKLYQIGQVVGFVDLIERESREDFPMSETAKWYCAVTNPNCQSRAALGLYDIGYRTFYPKVRRWVSHARVKTAKEKPLLGRYIFVEVDHPRQSFGAIRSVNGIEGIVSNPDPVQIPAAFVQRMRERYMDGEWDFVRTDYPCPYIHYNGEWDKGELRWRWNKDMPIGARIKIIEGEFSDMLATVIGRRRGKLEFKVLDSTRTGRINECSVRAA